MITFLQVLGVVAFLDLVMRSKHLFSNAHDLKYAFGFRPHEIAFEHPEFDFHVIDDQPRSIALRDDLGEFGTQNRLEKTEALEINPSSWFSDIENPIHVGSPSYRKLFKMHRSTSLLAEILGPHKTVSTTITYEPFMEHGKQILQQNKWDSLNMNRRSEFSSENQNLTEKIIIGDHDITKDNHLPNGKEKEESENRPWIAAQPETENITEPSRPRINTVALKSEIRLGNLSTNRNQIPGSIDVNIRVQEAGKTSFESQMSVEKVSSQAPAALPNPTPPDWLILSTSSPSNIRSPESVSLKTVSLSTLVPSRSSGLQLRRFNSSRRLTGRGRSSTAVLNEASRLAASSISRTKAIPIDNGVVGDPEIICGPTSLTVIFNTENPFEGNVFVKGLFNDDQCRVIGQDNARIAAIELPFGSCGVTRQRSLNPRGVFVSVTVVASFHPSFVTKVDRAVRAQCFYMEADKTVDTELEVSALTTGPDDLIDRQVLMPICRYEILDGGPDGNPLRFALIGQMVYHQWTCDSETTDTFCMTVYDCYVDDTAGDRIQLIDEDGCALDKHILNNLEYPSDLQAGVEAHVFKYADRPSTYYNCQIRIEIKDPGTECIRPRCPEPPRKKRSAEKADDAKYIVDVSIPNPLLVGDIDLSEDDVPSALLHPTHNKYSNPFSNWRPNTVSAYNMRNGVCMSPTGFGILICIGALFIISTLSMATLLCMRRTPNKNREF